MGFSIEEFARSCKEAMRGAEDPMEAARACLEGAIREHDAQEIIRALDAAVPAGASVGELIVHSSEELTLLYGRVPPKFQSGIHNHTVFACIGQLTGEERSVLYERSADGTGLEVKGTVSVRAGEVMTLPADAIHHIENPESEAGSALHLYGGDFRALMGDRSLWSDEAHQEQPFSFEALVRQSVLSMKRSGNSQGLQSLVEAMPVVAPMVNGS